MKQIIIFTVRKIVKYINIDERVEKIDTLSGDKHNHCGKALFCVFPRLSSFPSKSDSPNRFWITPLRSRPYVMAALPQQRQPHRGAMRSQ